MSEMLDFISDRSKAIVFGTVLFSSFWRLRKLIFDKKNFKILHLVFFLPKN